jgi:hypothetical protein
MLEIIALIVVTTGIAAYARGRGGSPLLWGILTVAGYIILEIGTAAVIHALKGEPNALVSLMLAWAWVGGIALYTRFGLGAGKTKPGGMWTCPNCKYLNAAYAVICEACKQPYVNPRRNLSEGP